MDANFWHQRWESNRLGFHQSQANPLLVAHFKELSIAQGGRVFVPLCGKTLDIAWLLTNGYQVAGAELSELAIQQLFEGLGIEPIVTDMGKLKHYSGRDIDIFVGDIFVLTHDMLGAVNAIFDRAALVALPEAMRIRYAKHLTNMTAKAAQLLITLEYDQTLMDGPPFSVGSEEVRRHYADSYDVSHLRGVDVQGGLKGITAATQHVWHLKLLTT